MKKSKSKLKLLRVKIANLNEISKIIGGTGNGDPDPTTKGNKTSKQNDNCASRVIILSVCASNQSPQDPLPQTDPSPGTGTVPQTDP